MQIQSSSLLSPSTTTTSSSPSVAAPQSTSVGQRASLPTQRQGSGLATWVNSFLDRLRPVRFPEYQRELLLNMFPENQHQEILPLLEVLRHHPLSVLVNEKEQPKGITMPLFQPVVHGDFEHLKDKELLFIDQLTNTLRTLNDLSRSSHCFKIQTDTSTGKLSLSVSLEGQTPEKIQTILTHLPAIIQAL